MGGCVDGKRAIIMDVVVHVWGDRGGQICPGTYTARHEDCESTTKNPPGEYLLDPRILENQSKY